MSFSLYNNLIIEIDMLETRISDMEREKEFLRKSMYANAPKFNGVVDYTKDHVTGGPVPLSLDKILERLNKIDDSIGILDQILSEKKRSKERIQMMLGSLEGIEYKVAFMRDVKRMRLYDIAQELGYSHDHIKRISSRIRKDATLMPPKH